MNKPSVLILGASTEVETALRRALKDVASISGSLAAPDRMLEEYRTVSPQLVLMVIGASAEHTFHQVHQLSEAGARVVVVGAAKDPDLILGAMRAGAKEFVVASDLAGLSQAVTSQARAVENKSGLGDLITVFPTRGGVGATTMAVNLAGALQRRGDRICLLDFDLYLGDVLSFLDLPGTYSITDVITNMRRLDRDLLDSSVTRHPSGLRVLAQSGKVEEAESVRPAEVVALLDFLRRHYGFLVIDGVAGFDELSLAVLDASQQIVMVLTQDVPSVRSTKRCLELFRRLGYDERKIRLVLNRYQRNNKITPQVITEALGLPVAHTVSNDFATAIDSINRGLMLQDVAPRSALTRDIEALAPQLAGEINQDEGKRGFLRGLWSRKGQGNDGTPRAA
jgi:pilus assembly protein CpaE